MNLSSGMSQKKKPGFYLDDDDQETSMYFSAPAQGMYRQPERDLMSSGSPSQIFGSNGQIYPQSLSRTYNGSTNFQRSTPTNGLGQATMMPPQSPNSRNVLGNLAQRGFNQIGQPYHTLQQQQQQSIQKRIGAMTSGYTSGFGQSQFSYQHSRAVGGDMQPGSHIGIDLSSSEFPSLGNRAIAPPNLSSSGIRNYVGMVGGTQKNMDGTVNEFSMQQEDFPALPGAQPASSSVNSMVSATNGMLSTAISESGKMSKDSFRPPEHQNLKPKPSVQTQPDGTVTNIPLGMVNDQFGMIGLLTFIRAAENDANLVALAPGADLMSLGLNLNSPENLYSTFQSPWAEGPCRAQDIDYHVPSEYLTNVFIREKLSPIKLAKYGEDLLFYLFYTNPGDVLQLAASAELYNRDWRYHKDDQLWITRAPGMEPIIKTNTYERGTYYFFDAQNWRKVPKEFHLEYSKLEERPQAQGHSTSQNTATQQQSVASH